MSALRRYGVRVVVCPYCHERAKLVPKPPHYWAWQCAPCDARVGCHGTSTRPLGTLADAETRAARIAAHDALDVLWRRAMRVRGWSRSRAREAAYRWLAATLDVAPESCHIALFDVATCARVVEACRRYLAANDHTTETDHHDDIQLASEPSARRRNG